MDHLPKENDPILKPPAQIMKAPNSLTRLRSSSFNNLNDAKQASKQKRKRALVIIKQGFKGTKFKKNALVSDVLFSGELTQPEKLSQLEERKAKIKQSYKLYMSWLSKIENRKNLSFSDYKSIRDSRKKHTDNYYQDIEDITTSIDYLKYLDEKRQLEDLLSKKQGGASVSNKVLPLEDEFLIHESSSDGEKSTSSEQASSSDIASGSRLVLPKEIIEYSNELGRLEDEGYDSESEPILWRTELKAPNNGVNTPLNTPADSSENSSPTASPNDSDSSSDREGPLDFISPKKVDTETEEYNQFKDLVEDVVRYFLE